MAVTISYVTCAHREEAKKLAHALVEEKLAACVNILSEVTSVYRWEGKVNEDSECLLVIKSIDRHSEKLVERVRALHSYDVPEVVSFPVASGNEAYLKWVESEVS